MIFTSKATLPRGWGGEGEGEGAREPRKEAGNKLDFGAHHGAAEYIHGPRQSWAVVCHLRT